MICTCLEKTLLLLIEIRGEKGNWVGCLIFLSLFCEIRAQRVGERDQWRMTAIASVRAQCFAVEVGCDRSEWKEAGLDGSVRSAGVGKWVRSD